ncbi:accessory Sec system protein Asp2 [Lactiplantibacillus plantarum]|uniref:accessory Sec system protein Asp2 n=1 Tax=Lactiplantibacillus plantarum TaxID=1590 RepID=UPI002943CCB7|nr:accessory Sec system protein Asp2 [Lactiplantibacillus plantarum]WOI05892.1 accessory Sec system protein Asp2 [Lactiplantibacillus plantarum]
MAKVNLIQLGGKLDLNYLYQLHIDQFFDFNFIKKSEMNIKIIKGKPLFDKNNQLNSVYKNAVFILDRTSEFLKKRSILQQLPANRTIVEKHSSIDPELYTLFNLRNYSFLDFDKNLTKKLIDCFIVKPIGTKFGMKDIYFTDTFKGDITLNGNESVSFDGTGRAEAIKVMGWAMNIFYDDDTNMEFYPECRVSTPKSELIFKVQIFKLDDTLENTITVTKTKYNLVKPTLIHFEKQGYMYVSVYIKGAGKAKFSIGQCHVLPYRHGKGDLSFGGEAITDTNYLNGRILFNFDAGDMKPPLNVYFGGFNRGDFFEGYGMLKKMGSPFILVSDTRLIGGAFYIGSQELENKLIDFISKKLALLHFSEDQLILAGLSMGTFGALYYASSLHPRAVVIGKPLLNIGNIALNEKVNRPGGFPESLDLLLMRNCDFSVNNATSLNEKFWKKFKNGDFSKTIFVIAYMKQDDYDSKAFLEISNYLKSEQLNVKIIHKGLIGRHNDNTSGIVEFFAKQWENLLDDLYKNNFY